MHLLLEFKPYSSPELTALGVNAIWLSILMPTLSVIESYFQGLLVQGRQTKAITEAEIIYLMTSSSILVAGTYYGQVTGLYVGMSGAVIGLSFQAFWLWKRSQALWISPSW